MASDVDDRRVRLEHLAKLAHTLQLSVVWTVAVGSKEIRKRDWQLTPPVSGPVRALQGEFFTRGQKANPMINLRGSRLFGVECDGQKYVDLFESFCAEHQVARSTMIVQSGGGTDRLHFYYRLSDEIAGDVPKVSCRFEGDTVKAASNNAFACPPAIHPNGNPYVWLQLPETRESIPVLNSDQYSRLLKLAADKKTEQKERVQAAGMIEDGSRGDALFGHARQLFRWGHSDDEVVSILDAWQREPVTGGTRFRNPHPLKEVRRQVLGAKAYADAEGAVDIDALAAIDTSALAVRAPELVVVQENGQKVYGGLTLRRSSDVRNRALPWLVKGKIVANNINLLAGVGGLGKSAWALALAARVTRGHIPSGKPENVIVISTEDSMEHVIGPRLDAAGADRTRVLEVVSAETVGRTVTLPSDYQAFEAIVRDVRPALVIIDPFVAALDLKLDSHKDQHVRSVLSPMAMLGMELQVAMLPIVHLNKAPTGEAYLRVGNSVGFWNAARSVIMVVDDPESDDEDHRVVFQAKPNYAKVGYPERWRFETITLPESDPETGEPLEAPHMVYVEDAWELDREDLLNPPKKRSGRLEEAMKFLRERLADGPVLQRVLVEAAEAAGISRATLYRAAKEAGVGMGNHGDTDAKWQLP